MAQNYHTPWQSGVDKARFVLGDFVAGKMVLEDSDYTSALADDGWDDGLATCATALASYYAGRISTYKVGSGDAEIDWLKDRHAYYTNLAKQARLGAIPEPASPYRVTSGVATAKSRSCAREELL